MKEQITQNAANPEMLEKLFRLDNASFTHDFNEATAGKDSDLIKFWRIRLNNPGVIRHNPSAQTSIISISVISLIIALLVKIPLALTGKDTEDFYIRNLCILIFAGLTTWFIIKNRLTDWKNILFLALPCLALAIYMNLLPGKMTDTTMLAFIHAPLFMMFIFGLAFISLDMKNTVKVSGFIRYCGELMIMTGLMAIAGAMLAGMTIGLFEVIGITIGEVYLENIAVIGIAVLPVISAWLIDLYPGITERIAPVISRIFTPLVLLLSIIYLATISFSRVSLSEDREFLLIFNILLLCVMAIIFFSLSELDKSNFRKLNVVLLFLLTVVSLMIDVFALTAIITRLSEGFTPNRTVVLVSNILILVNLLLVLPDLFLAGFKGKPLNRMESIINRYLLVYFLYCVVVIFIFPFIF